MTGEEYTALQAALQNDIEWSQMMQTLLDEVYQLGYNDGVDDAQRGVHD